MKPLGEGHHIYADRYYTTNNLLKFLNERKTYFTGTYIANRKNFPKDLLQPIKHLESKYSRSKSGILACNWRDKKSKKSLF